MSHNIHKGRYYYELQSTLKRMKRECFICQSTDELQPHHIRQVKTTNNQYSNENNVVWLCREHHKKYHRMYRKVNQKTFAEYCIRQKQKEINRLNKQLEKTQIETERLYEYFREWFEEERGFYPDKFYELWEEIKTGRR